MIAVDTNILVYAHRADSPFHRTAFELMRGLVEGDRRWALPWPCIHEFLAKATHPRIFKKPTPLERAVAQVEQWRRSPSGVLIGEVDGYLELLYRTLLESKVTGPKIHDARIVAICEAHGIEELWSADRDFNRFGRLRVTNPIAASLRTEG